MKGGYLKVTVTQSDEVGVGTHTEIENITYLETLAAIGSLAVDVVKYSEEKIDIETVINVIRKCFYEGF